MNNKGIDDGLEHLKHGTAEERVTAGTAQLAYEMSPFRFGMLDFGRGIGYWVLGMGIEAGALQRTATRQSYRPASSGQLQRQLSKSSSCIGLIPSSAARRMYGRRSCCAFGHFNVSGASPRPP